jgi:hypothetical protein
MTPAEITVRAASLGVSHTERKNPAGAGKRGKRAPKNDENRRAVLPQPEVVIMNPLPLDQRLIGVFDYIDAHLHRQTRLTVLELSQLSGLSVPRFSHLFALALGVTPGRYVKLCRAGILRVEVRGALSKEQRLEPDPDRFFVNLQYLPSQCGGSGGDVPSRRATAGRDL